MVWKGWLNAIIGSRFLIDRSFQSYSIALFAICFDFESVRPCPDNLSVFELVHCDPIHIMLNRSNRHFTIIYIKSICNI